MTLPTASRQVVTDLHLRMMRAVVMAESVYGGNVALRLEGGTALAAYHLVHRESEDLDFFGGPGLNCADFARAVGEQLHPVSLHLSRSGPSNAGFAEFFVEALAAPRAPSAQALKVQFGRNSPFQLEPPILTSEGIRVGSYRDLCAGKLHAICDRIEPRDFLDVHAILRHRLPDNAHPELELRRRIRRLVADLMTSDPGVTLPFFGQCLARGLRHDLLAGFPLRLLRPITSEEVYGSTELCIGEIANMVREGWDATTGRSSES
jgi:hypothetical protein